MPVERDAGATTRRRSSCRGGPSVVYAPGAPQVDRGLFEAGVPVFGICYGFQAMAQALGGEVARTGVSRVRPHRRRRSPSAGTLLAGLPPSTACG